MDHVGTLAPKQPHQADDRQKVAPRPHPRTELVNPVECDSPPREFRLETLFEFPYTTENHERVPAACVQAEIEDHHVPGGPSDIQPCDDTYHTKPPLGALGPEQLAG